MKRSKITLEQICSFSNCKAAIQHAARRKKNRPKVAAILEDIDKYAWRLRAFLMNPSSEFHDGERAVINEGTTKKRRELAKPRFFPDHCAHWAVMRVVGKVLNKSFYIYSCASINGRGTHYAKRAVEHALRDLKGTKYCLQIDVKSFYASIDKDILVETLHRKFKDRRVVAVLEKIIRSYSGPGLPIGFYTSATLANFYLTEADQFLKETLKVKYLVRYMDDIVMYAPNKRSLHETRARLCEFIGEKRKLRIKPNWQVYKMPYLKDKHERPKRSREHRATDFVGFKFYRYKTTIRKSIFLRLLRCLRRLNRKPYTVKRAHSFMAYNGYMKHTNSENVRRRYIYGKIKISKLKELIRDESRNYNQINNQPGTVHSAPPF